MKNDFKIMQKVDWKIRIKGPKKFDLFVSGNALKCCNKLILSFGTNPLHKDFARIANATSQNIERIYID